MATAYDIAWRILLSAVAPACGFSPKFRRKVAKAFRERMAHQVPVAPPDAATCVMIHAVSLGEINATRTLVDQLKARRPDLRFLITVTTDTGFARGQQLYGQQNDVTLVRYPLDLSSAIDRLLERQRPSVAVLIELEVWPNFVAHCRQRQIPVILVNGRLTESSYKHYRFGGPLIRHVFGQLSDVCVQDAAYAERFRALGAKSETLTVTGTMKFDTAQIADRIPGDRELAAAVGLHPDQEPIWVCGSTGPGEERLILNAYRELLASHPTLRLAIIPRHPERFYQVAELIQKSGFGVVRRSSRPDGGVIDQEPQSPSIAPPVVLGDTMGELRKFYSLADVVFVGRTLVDLGQRQRGSDMIEPAALAKPVIVGPWTHNFADAMRQLQQAEGVIVVPHPSELAAAVSRVLNYPSEARDLGDHARAVVKSQQGATARHVEVILRRLQDHSTRAPLSNALVK